MNARPIFRLRLVAFAAVTSILLGACLRSELASAEIASPDSLSTIDTFHSAINSEDVDAVLTLFAEDAIVVDGVSVIQGKDQIRNWLLYSSAWPGCA